MGFLGIGGGGGGGSAPKPPKPPEPAYYSSPYGMDQAMMKDYASLQGMPYSPYGAQTWMNPGSMFGGGAGGGGGMFGGMLGGAGGGGGFYSNMFGNNIFGKALDYTPVGWAMSALSKLF